MPIAPGLVLENQLNQNSVVIEEGDNVEDVNFSMLRGGVITGKITDADGRPVVEEPIFLEVAEGSETDDIDIMMGRPFTAFKVTGRIVDGETGKPVPNIEYGIFQGSEGMGQSTSGSRANANGEFKFEGG